MQRVVTGTVILFLTVLLAALLATPPQDRNHPVERGKYLVENVAMCIECHTPRNSRGELDKTKLFHGAPVPVRSPFEDQKWAFRAPSIAGLPGWTAPEAVRLLETGRRSGGLSPEPPMPSYKMTRSDAEAVVRYLKSLR